MDATAWLTLAGVLVALAAIVVPLAVRKSDKAQRRIELLEAENRALLAANTELRIQLSALQSTAAVVDRVFAVLPRTLPAHESGATP